MMDKYNKEINNMIKSVMAGFMIALAATFNIVIGGTIGAIVFSLGLITILFNGYNLFTGKAGLLARNEIHPMELCSIWFGNFVGTMSLAVLIGATDLAQPVGEAAQAINAIRLENIPITNLVMGMICGILMSLAVYFYNYNRIYLTIMCVTTFVLFGANHCVADMFYLLMGNSLMPLIPLVSTTVGNIIGCNLVDYVNKYVKKE